jgi:hypothetical protein
MAFVSFLAAMGMAAGRISGLPVGDRTLRALLLERLADQGNILPLAKPAALLTFQAPPAICPPAAPPPAVTGFGRRPRFIRKVQGP